MLRKLAAAFSFFFLVTVVVAGGGLYALWHYGRGLPDYLQLADYEPDVTSRTYAGNGAMLAEYAHEKRFFVPIEAIPRQVIQAFLSAEDKNFMHHGGLDPTGILRAVAVNVRNLGTERRLVGASTITQQVAKNFLLSSERTLDRKIKEAILAMRIERTFSKSHILELYLNEIYLGYRSYGVAMAAMNYFNKSLDELTLAEAAFLASLPKAPNNYDPRRHYDAAIGRRNWVLSRMSEDAAIPPVRAEAAQAEPIRLREREPAEIMENARYFNEEVRREMIRRYGENALYEEGLAVRTTLDGDLQAKAVKALRAALIEYDRGRGYRGPQETFAEEIMTAPLPVEKSRPPPEDVEEKEAEVESSSTEKAAYTDLGEGVWPVRLTARIPPPGMPADWQQAVVLSVDDKAARIGLADRAEIGEEGETAFYIREGRIPLEELKWAREVLEDQERSPEPVEKPADVLSGGDVVLVEALEEPEIYGLRQMPDVEGAIVAMDPHTGRILAMSGGFAYARSQYNRATQAERQPGSAFKPFVYLAALEEGYTPATLILDAPFVLDQGPGQPKWKPHNYSKIFYGPTTLRMGIEKSRNVMTVRLAQALGMNKVADVAERFNVVDRLPASLAMSLGAKETTPLRLTTAYAMLVNGGRKIHPSLLDRVQDRKGRTIFRHDDRACPKCRNVQWKDQEPPEIPDPRPRVTDPLSAYQMVHILQGVVENGTGRRLRSIGKPLAGKTGTTNKNVDTWFMGFSPDLAAGVFVGLDEPRTMGPGQTGARVALPAFKKFMKAALADEPGRPFRTPPGIRFVRINRKTGKPAQPGDSDVIMEAFKPDAETSEKVIRDDVELDDEDLPSLGGFY